MGVGNHSPGLYCYWGPVCNLIVSIILYGLGKVVKLTEYGFLLLVSVSHSLGMSATSLCMYVQCTKFGSREDTPLALCRKIVMYM